MAEVTHNNRDRKCDNSEWDEDSRQYVGQKCCHPLYTRISMNDFWKTPYKNYDNNIGHSVTSTKQPLASLLSACAKMLIGGRPCHVTIFSPQEVFLLCCTRWTIIESLRLGRLLIKIVHSGCCVMEGWMGAGNDSGTKGGLAQDVLRYYRVMCTEQKAKGKLPHEDRSFHRS